MSDDREENNEREKAPFNMAIDTLRRLGKILEKVTEISTSSLFLPAQRQEIKINYVKQFFVQASPLLRKEIIKEYKPRVDKLKPVTIKRVINRTGNTSLYDGFEIIYNHKLEIELNQILVELQISLAEDGYFMPPSDEDMF